MEEGKIATAWAQLVRLKKSMYIRMRVLPWVTLLLAWGRLGSISAPLVNQPVVLLVQLNVREYGRRKIATAWAQFGATERSPSMYIRMRVLPWNTSLSVGQVGINFSSFW
jgi:hypothetical protein